MITRPATCHFCLSSGWNPSFSYEAPPPGETPFQFAPPYQRRYWQCLGCGHYYQESPLDFSRLYDADYVTATYGDAEKLRKTFEHVSTLPPERSDNEGRVHRVCGWASRYLSPNSRELLDVGAGIGVFPWRMGKEGWNCTALDTDLRQIDHLCAIGLRAIRGDFRESSGLSAYDLISFNKVLEHVSDPIGMLSLSRSYLRPEGVVYVELPDGEEAALHGAGREEFFLEHLHVFSLASCCLLLRRAGFVPLLVERLREPSGKYTLCALGTSPVKGV